MKCSSSSGSSAADNEMMLLCSLDDDRPSRYISYTNTITIRYTTGLRALAQYNDGFVANYTLSEYFGFNHRCLSNQLPILFGLRSMDFLRHDVLTLTLSSSVCITSQSHVSDVKVWANSLLLWYH